MNIRTEYLGYDLKKDAENDKQSSFIFKNIKAPLDSKERTSVIFKRIKISEELKNELQNLKVKVQFILKDEINSCHFFTARAEYNDGRERICYVKLEYDKLIISEYKGSRTTPYSSYYKILEKEFVKVGIGEKQGLYIIDLNNIKEFKQCINNINSYIEDNKLHMFIENNIHDLRIGDKKLYYNIMYWHEENNYKEDTKLSELVNVIQSFLNIVTVESDEEFKENHDEILEGFKKIDEIKELFYERSSYIAKVEDLHRTLKA